MVRRLSTGGNPSTAGAAMKTEKQKMLAGELYDPSDPQLSREREHARRLLKQFNDSPADAALERVRLLWALLADAGAGAWIEPPFFCDYGSNIHLGEQVFFNFNCVVLDVAPVSIGSRVLFGPACRSTQPPTRCALPSAAVGWSTADRWISMMMSGWVAVRSSALACGSAPARSSAPAAWSPVTFPTACWPPATRAGCCGGSSNSQHSDRRAASAVRRAVYSGSATGPVAA